MRYGITNGLAALLLIPAAAAAAAESAPKVPVAIDLSNPFHAPPGWRLTVTQGSEEVDPFGDGTTKIPGPLHLCLSRDNGQTCRPAVETMLIRPGERRPYDSVHYLNALRILHPRTGRAILWVQAASIHGGNGDQAVGTVALAYDRVRDRFEPIYRFHSGRNNNQEVRYIDRSVLRGAILSAQPTTDAPFAFWMTVDRRAANGRYTPILRYRSATRYGDGNPLAVIDSEMPEIQRRLKLLAPGKPLPLPEGPCPSPRLIERELWCTQPPGRVGGGG